MLCILAVFVPAFFMQGAARNLFVPLALAVGFAMVASYVLSSTLVPVLVVWLLTKTNGSRGADPRASIGFATDIAFRPADRTAAMDLVPVYLPSAADRCLFSAARWAVRFFRPLMPASSPCDAGAAGTRIEETEKLANQTLDDYTRARSVPKILDHLGFVGVQNADYPINTIYLWTSGPEEAVLQVQLKPKAGTCRGSRRTAAQKCRRSCPASASASSPATSSAG